MLVRPSIGFVVVCMKVFFFSHKIDDSVHWQSSNTTISVMHCIIRLLLFSLCSVAATPPTKGPFDIRKYVVEIPALDETGRGAAVYHPNVPSSSSSSTTETVNDEDHANATTNTSPQFQKFPLIVYAHGFAGGSIALLGYDSFFEQLASYGFVVIAHDSCDMTCHVKAPTNYTSCAGLPEVFPDGWSSYYGETLKVIEWSHLSTSVVNRLIDFSHGIGIAGHSMGGQSTALAATDRCVEEWNITSAALHHPAMGDSKDFPDHNIANNISKVPLAAFTSSGDHLCNASYSLKYVDDSPTTELKLYRNLVGWSHLEPVMHAWGTENPFLATFTAFWFQATMLQNETARDYLVNSSNKDSLCNYAPMAQCFVRNA